ncbi:hypothetical protein [Janthinobacterium sp.]|uniref:hypothetical protein n=1 Tax=Janthinobacterium sp. TaxID=1871054 RepID=UPI0028969188|nr:hypothetical protein [Janthinobacterium sp.]
MNSLQFIGHEDNVARYATVIQTAGACLAAAWNILQIDDQESARYSGLNFPIRNTYNNLFTQAFFFFFKGTP